MTTLRTPAATTPVESLLRLRDVAARFQVSLRTVQSWRASGRLRVHVLGHVVRVAQSEIDRLLKESQA